MTSTPTSERPESRASSAAVAIRFPQCDPAGIVFYPRYFEIVLQQFPDVPFATMPCAIKTQFLRPNRLGDNLDIEYVAGDAWSVTGRMEGHDCFVMNRLDDDVALEDESHLPDESAFRAKGLVNGEWALDRQGRMHLSRYFEFLNMSIELWFEDTLGVPFAELHVGRRIGIPTVQFDTRIRELPVGDSDASIWIRPLKIGERSMTFTSWLVANDRCLAENKQVVVFVEMQDDGYTSIPIPKYIADAFSGRVAPVMEV